MPLNSIPMILADKNATFWFPPRASTFAEETDAFFMYIMWIATFFFVLVVGTMVAFMFKYRRRPGYRGDSRALHNNALEITWTVIPTLIVIWIFARGVNGYIDMVSPPAETLDINVTARKWDWSFQYPNGAISDELHVPVDRPIKLLMRSEDVLHAFYVPAFRAKADVVPGRVTNMWFKPILEGTYDLFCAEYCGDQHSEMIKRQGVHVHDLAGYETWVAEAAQPPEHPVAHGYWLYSRMGCKSCHSVEDNKRIVGPSFAGSFGESFTASDGSTVEFDEEYVRTSILEPQKQYREGYQSASQMPSFQGKLNEQELTAITYFLKVLKEDAGFQDAIIDGDLTKDEAAALGYVGSADAEEGEAAQNGDAEGSDTEGGDAEETASEGEVETPDEDNAVAESAGDDSSDGDN